MKKIFYGCVITLSLLFLFLIFVDDDLKRIIIISSFSILLAGIAPMFALKRECSDRWHLRSNLKIGSGIFICTFAIRAIYFVMMKDKITQGSDFGVILTYAQNGEYRENLFYYRMFPHKLLYPVFLHFTGLRDQSKILFFQFICVSVIAVLIFLVGKEIGKRKTGLIASVIYAVWPAQIIYSTVITEEHIAALLTILCVYLIIRYSKYLCHSVIVDKRAIGKIMSFALGIGVLSGICVFFKDWCIIILIAMIMAGSLGLKSVGRKRGVLFLGCLVLIMFSRLIVKQSIKTYAENILGETVNTQNIPCYIYVSLNPYSSGGWNRELYNEYFQFVRDNDHDYDTANIIAMKELKKQIMEAPRENMPKLLLSKIRKAYVNDSAMILGVAAMMNEEDQKKYGTIFEWIDKIDQVYYLMIVTFVVVSVFHLVRHDNGYVFWMVTIIIGGILLSMIVECQSRYKYSIQTIWCIMAAYGICQIHDVTMILKGLVSKERKRDGL